MANIISENQNSAAELLATCLLEMAKVNTNPVLQIINPDIPLEENKKYPIDLLHFQNKGWRAYYHCHPATRAGTHRFKGEHGHFHLFVRTTNNPETWCHLVALAINPMGQPLGWFTVNHWVTGEKWISAENIVKHLKSIPYDKQVTLVECWLLSILALDLEKVKSLLFERDKILKKYQLDKKNENVKQDKNIYLLSETPIELKKLLNIDNT